VIIEILTLLIITRLLIFIIGYISVLVFSETRPAFFEIPNLFFKWDSNWYLQIAKEGYDNLTYIDNEYRSLVVFFPLYPMLIRIFSFGFFNPKIIGFIISNVALVFASVYLYKLTKLEFKDKSLAIKSVFFMLIFPVSFFFSIFYTEGLFLALAISCFYYARKKQWLIASFLGFFLSLTRSIGFLIFIPMLMEYLDLDFNAFKVKKEKVKKDILYLLLVPAGLIAYEICLWIKSKDPFVYFKAEAGWGRKLAPIFDTFYIELAKHHYYYQWIAVFTVIFVLLLIVHIYFSELRLSYTIYSLILFVLPISTTLAASIPRYCSVIFPIYISMALISKKNKYLDYFLVIFSIAMLSLMTVIFVNAWLA